MSAQSHQTRAGMNPSARAPPRYYAVQKTLQRNDSLRNSTVPPRSHENPNSSESVYSDEKSIFNAIRVTTPNEGSRNLDYPYVMGPVMETGLATNMAMFIPTGSSNDGESSTQHRRSGRKLLRVDGVGRQNQMLSEQNSQRTSQLGSAHPNDTNHTSSPFLEYQRRKAISLDADAHGPVSPHPRPSWPASNIPAAVTPAQPQYPPPERTPTPPGLPSFNTPEAVYCSAQFMIGHTASSRTRGTPPSNTANRPSSYGDAVRRFLGLQPASHTEAINNGIVGIGRAPDGTIVQGRFPYRQSGHGTNQVRRLQDHPFHQNCRPIATLADQTTDPEGSHSTGVRAGAGVTNERVTEGDDTNKNSEQQDQPKRKSRHLGLSLLGRPLSSRIEELRNRAITPGPRANTSPIPDQISPLQLPQPVYNFTQNGNPPGDEVLKAGSYALSDILSWLPLQCYLCCCFCGSQLGEVGESVSPESADALETVDSRETYATARSRNSGPDDRDGNNGARPSSCLNS
ncbi:uncharacterized protein N7483_004571 [Penicillium malachiteum]|uniref:uncharacterized protein n=1 Tax=Penicillium malachiteum TaxID=1324776 RepID=UPI0025472E0D|nr:uncharacterized protein N7483_004571 [Penicillium malachiteum]KAJ5730063.1 hypothetical protein N7483_004571 [Penicillium malachiteum]